MGNLSLNWNNQRKVAEPFVSVLTFPNGYIGTIPSVRASKRGGWIYHPLEGTEKKPVTLGRADEGRRKAANLIEFLITQTYEANDWETPINAIPPIGQGEADVNWVREGASVLFQIKNYGWVKLGVVQERASWRDTNTTWNFYAALPAVVVTALAKQVVGLNHPVLTVKVNIPDIETVSLVSDMFIDDPLGGYANALRKYGAKTGTVNDNGRDINDVEISVDDVANIIDSMEPVYKFQKERWAESAGAYGSREYNNTGTGKVEASYSVSNSFLMASPQYRVTKINESFAKTAETLKTAFGAMGVNVDILTDSVRDVNNDWIKVITGITVSVPPGVGGDKHNRDGHTFEITQTGVMVTCGYVDNEEKYIDDASRQALSDMQQLLEG